MVPTSYPHKAESRMMLEACATAGNWHGMLVFSIVPHSLLMG
jgi:hypothetical protein